MRLRSLAVWLVAPAAIGLLAPSGCVFAAQPAGAPAPRVHDVALDGEGRLAGVICDVDDRPLAGIAIAASGPNHDALTTISGPDGRFHFQPLAGGVYRFAGADAAEVYRVWRRESAPPGATGDIRLVAGSGVLRGQSPRGGFFRSDAFLISAAVIGAVAIPIAIFAAQRDLPPGS